MRKSSSQTIAEQLRPLRDELHQPFASVAPVSQVTLNISGDEAEKTFERCRQEVLSWLANRVGKPLPESAWAGRSFKMEEVGAQRAAVTTLNDPRYWTARLDDADKQVPQRVWITEVGIASNPEGGTVFGARLVCSTRGEFASIGRSVPGFVRQVVDLGGVTLDGRPAAREPTVVSNQENVERLVMLLRNKNRRRNVIVLSLPEGSEDVAEAAVSASDICQKTLGAAHVFVITSSATFLLSDAVGREFSVFQQAIRTYRPGFDEAIDEPYAHPLTMARSIFEWPQGGATAYTDFLADRALADTVAHVDLEKEVPSFAAIRQVAAHLRMQEAREADATDSELLELAGEEIRTLEKEQKELEYTSDRILDAVEKERDEALASANAALAQVVRLRARLDTLEAALTSQGEPQKVPIPDSLDNFPQWCDKYLSGSVEVLSRAKRGVKQSEYAEPALIFKALLLLRDYYVPMRRHGEDKGGYEKAREDIGLARLHRFSVENAVTG